jgi:peptidoglycan/xylan/chitin deacetylase (PgdA/CDA1 family)/uncharacterized caspase-like protein
MEFRLRRRLPFAPCVLVFATAVTAACGQSQPPKPANGSVAATPAPSSPAEPVLSPSLPGNLARIVDAYRKTIVLLESENSLDADAKTRAVLVGRLLYQENHQRLTALTETLSSQVAGGGPPDATTAFLDALETHPELHDVDKLAFLDVVNDLGDALRAAKDTNAAKMLIGRVQSDQQALKEIQGLYNKELEKIFGRFDTRGMPVRREAWESYVAFLRTRYAPIAIMKEYNDAVQAVLGLRGGLVRSGESLLEVSGTRLPPKTIVLTFDDGPHPKYTDRIREILNKYHVGAVFFEVGQNLATVDKSNKIRLTRAAAASQQLVAGGFQVGNHTYSHELLPKLSDHEIASQIEMTDRMLRAVDKTPAALFRPPYGARNEKVLAAVQARGMKAVLWNIDSRDWADPIPDSIANRVLQLAESEHRGIVLFHDIQARTVEALPTVIEALQKRGYRFATWNHGDFAVGSGALVAENADPPAVPARALYHESWAVIVGIDEYAHWPKLSYAANDAKAMRDLLVEKYAFKPENITTLLNQDGTRDRILSAIGDNLADPGKVNREDRVFVFFAGHGATRRLPNGRALGYIVPVDADVTNYQSQAISMTNFQDASEAIPAKHVFFMTDACYSGLAATRGGAQNYLQEVTRRTARQVLTAGGSDEEVADNGPNGHSIFTWTVMQGLDGRADLNNDGFITASELAAYVGPVVSSLSRQTPAFASLPGSDGGEFVFELKHENEFLGEQSAQLDGEASRLNTELDQIRAALAAKRQRNDQLKRQIATARAQLEATAAPGAVLPRTAAQHIDRGVVLFRERRYGDAQKEFLEALRLSPSNALAANNVGYTYAKMEQYDEAVKWFAKTLELDPRRAIAHANLGDSYLALGRTADARQQFETYLELQPSAKYASTIRERLQHLP